MNLSMHDFFSLQNLAEAAVRSLVVAGFVGGVLWLARVRNAAAQKSAWAFVLAGSLLMPLLTPVVRQSAWLPGAVQFDAATLNWLSNRMHRTKPAAVSTEAQQPIVSSSSDAPASGDVPGSIAAPQRLFSDPVAPRSDSPMPAAVSHQSAPQLPDLSLLLYGMIAGLLFVRLIVGLVASAQLWYRAERVTFSALPEFEHLRLRSSTRVSSPVTIGSSILLPADCSDWDEHKLRMVLAHEATHVRQGDFYLQLCAELYIVFFWFNPLGWWLRNRICDLSETISDGAAVNATASHISYAQILLEFAALPRPTTIGVAMARPGVSSRIERLLNESSFRQAFTGSPIRKIIAGAVVPAVLIAATALLHVTVKAAQTPEPAPIPAPVAPAAVPAIPAVPAASPDVAPVAPVSPVVMQESDGQNTDSDKEISPAKTAESGRKQTGFTEWHSSRSRYSHASSWNGHDFYALSNQGWDSPECCGGMLNQRDAYEKARNMAHGEFFWFSNNGKIYMLEDPTAIASLKSLYDKMGELGRQQGELGKQQEALGREQAKFAEKMAQQRLQIQKPDLTKEMANLPAAMASLQAAKGATISQEQLAEIQGKLAEMQARLGSLHGEMGMKMSELGAQQGKLGAMQGELGSKQGRLGAEQGRLAHEADQKARSIIDESLKNGKARPVQ